MKKIPTLFQRDFDNDPRWVTREVSPGCEWVLAGEGEATRKFDGTCARLDEDGRWWARREVKADQVQPQGFVAVEYDAQTQKMMGWVPAEDSSFWKFMLQAIDGPAAPTEPGTYELIGPKVNQNPENASSHVLVRHSTAPRFDDAPRDFDGLWQWLHAHDYEGIVWHHPDGRMAKIKRRDFPWPPPEPESAVRLPEVLEDEDGMTFFAQGHVEPIPFLLAIGVDLGCNVGPEEMLDFLTRFATDDRGVPQRWRVPAIDELVPKVEHLWYRHDRLPEDDEHMAPCAANAEGALPFTRFVFS